MTKGWRCTKRGGGGGKTGVPVVFSLIGFHFHYGHCVDSAHWPPPCGLTALPSHMQSRSSSHIPTETCMSVYICANTCTDDFDSSDLAPLSFMTAIKKKKTAR